MIIKIKQKPEAFESIIFVTDDLLLFCSALGFFDNLIRNEKFYRTYPIISLTSIEKFDEFMIDLIPDLTIIEELMILMKKLDFDAILKQVIGVREIYIFRHNRESFI
jgi:hypothetical protein